jgi:glycosyltransferase involved in cell wall biosynthesis
VLRAGIYNEPSGAALGGTEVSVAILAEALARTHDVEIVHHRDWLTREALAAFSGANLDDVRLRYTAPSRPDFGKSGNPWRRLDEARAWQAAISEPYDLFINVTHGVPPHCHAKRGVLYVLFPMWTPVHNGDDASMLPWQIARRMYAREDWRRRMASYSAVLAISRYTSHWVHELWDADAGVIYPPAEGVSLKLPKDLSILSVGRFASRGHVKCQREMVGAFNEMSLDGWQYVLAGSIGDAPDDVAYAGAVREAAKDRPITIASDVKRPALLELYARARIFWHAAGFLNTANHPELNEHFGITTVEAMSAGCVPVVVNRGGQPEIVEHGVSGFLWNTLDELRQFTRQLAGDDALWARMSQAARDRARQFDRAHYVQGFLRHLSLEVR